MGKTLRLASLSLLALVWLGSYAPGWQDVRWVDQLGVPTTDAETAMSALRHVEDDGLDPADFDAHELDVEAAVLRAAQDSPNGSVRSFEARLTRNMLRYLSQLHLGRVDPRAVRFAFDRADAHDFRVLLESAVSRHQLEQAFDDLRPPFAQYRGLRDILRRLRQTDPGSPHVRQIELALDRLRWLPDLDRQRVLVVNIPMFALWAFEEHRADGAPALEMGVIVGRARTTRTPVFAAEMGSIVFRPYWYIPESILKHEILPAVARDPDYLQRHDMEIVPGTRSVRQRPGPGNSLGLVKFVFANPYDVYMHATPTIRLFGERRRDFSHGCIRVEDPVALAAWVLDGQDGWTRDAVIAAMGGTATRTVELSRPVRVLLFYTTAMYVPADGTIRFADDIYGYDALLDQALRTRAEQVE